MRDRLVGRPWMPLWYIRFPARFSPSTAISNLQNRLRLVYISLSNAFEQNVKRWRHLIVPSRSDLGWKRSFTLHSTIKQMILYGAKFAVTFKEYSAFGQMEWRKDTLFCWSTCRLDGRIIGLLGTKNGSVGAGGSGARSWKQAKTLNLCGRALPNSFVCGGAPVAH